MGVGAAQPNYLSYGSFERDSAGKKLVFPAGVIKNIDLNNIKIEPVDQGKITEAVNYSWYKQTEPKHPYEGDQVFDLEHKQSYSFVKAPRYNGDAMEVGPLARMLVAKNPQFLGLVKKGVKPGVVARHAARAIETQLVVDACYEWLDELTGELTKPGFKIHDTEHWDPPAQGQGAGFFDAPRGALGHWIKIKDHKIEKYQAVVPSTWLASPRCNNHKRGPYEESLIGVPVPDPDNPINVVRVIRSFDPCLACAIHLIDPHTNELKKFLVE
jgi:hydrogenase large subunit